MLRTWLANWDRRLSLEVGPPLPVRPMELGFELAFPEAGGSGSIEAFLTQAEQATEAAKAFYSHPRPETYSLDGNDLLSFPSGIRTGDPVNDMVWARVMRSYRKAKAIVIIRHWSAPDESYADLANALRALGYTVVLPTLPHHGRRRAQIADGAEFLSANLGKTIRSIRQSVIDVRNIIDWLATQGYGRIAVIGASLGSCVAGIIGALDSRVGYVGLLLTAGDFGEVVWTGQATQHIRTALEGLVTLEQLRRAWQPISTSSYVKLLAERRVIIEIVSARMDTVILPPLTQRFCDELRQAGLKPGQVMLPCGHHTMGAFPFNVLALSRIARTLPLL